VTIAGLPVLLLLSLEGAVLFADLPVLILMPFTWGAVTGLGLTVWAYEPVSVRRWGERLVLAAVVVYLVFGILAGENLRQWLAWLPDGLGGWLLSGFAAIHIYNPFAVVKYAMEQDPGLSWPRALGLELAGLALAGVLLARGGSRLKGH